MPSLAARTVARTLAPALLALAALAACNGAPEHASRPGMRAAGEDAREDTHDPCTLLAAGEAAPYVGPLVSPPYRSSDGAADARGDECMYRGTDGRQITVRPDWTGGGAAAAGDGGLDTTTHRVVGTEVAGPWDSATWIPGGALFASRGERSAQIDVSGASGWEDDAVALARIVMPRLERPLRYDGAAAVALAPKPHPRPVEACDVIPRWAVEAAIGPLDGSPTSDVPETGCSYRVATARGVQTYPVEFRWEDGEKNYRMLIHGLTTVDAVMGEHTTLQGPWDRAALLPGTRLIGVRHDVLVGIGLQAADLGRARALLAAICSRL